MTVYFRIMEKAYKLKEAREEEQRKFVEDAYARQWRDACDDARTLDSVALTKYMNNQRLQQLEEKMRAKEQLTLEENRFVASWKQQVAEMEEEENKAKEKRLQAELDTKDLIKNQV
jgi:hypothetical protein